MKLIALRDFANNFNAEIEDPVHDRHVHKGAVLDIGAGKALKDLPAAERSLVAQLFVSGCVGDATDEKVVKAVREEIAIDKKREATAARLNQASDSSQLVAALTALVQKASGNVAAAAAGGKKD